MVRSPTRSTPQVNMTYHFKQDDNSLDMPAFAPGVNIAEATMALPPMDDYDDGSFQIPQAVNASDLLQVGHDTFLKGVDAFATPFFSRTATAQPPLTLDDLTPHGSPVRQRTPQATPSRRPSTPKFRPTPGKGRSSPQKPTSPLKRGDAAGSTDANRENDAPLRAVFNMPRTSDLEPHIPASPALAKLKADMESLLDSPPEPQPLTEIAPVMAASQAPQSVRRQSRRIQQMNALRTGENDNDGEESKIEAPLFDQSQELPPARRSSKPKTPLKSKSPRKPKSTRAVSPVPEERSEPTEEELPQGVIDSAQVVQPNIEQEQLQPVMSLEAQIQLALQPFREDAPQEPSRDLASEQLPALEPEDASMASVCHDDMEMDLDEDNRHIRDINLPNILEPKSLAQARAAMDMSLTMSESDAARVDQPLVDTEIPIATSASVESLESELPSRVDDPHATIGAPSVLHVRDPVPGVALKSHPTQALATAARPASTAGATRVQTGRSTQAAPGPSRVHKPANQVKPAPAPVRTSKKRASSVDQQDADHSDTRALKRSKVTPAPPPKAKAPTRSKLNGRTQVTGRPQGLSATARSRRTVNPTQTRPAWHDRTLPREHMMDVDSKGAEEKKDPDHAVATASTLPERNTNRDQHAPAPIASLDTRAPWSDDYISNRSGSSTRPINEYETKPSQHWTSLHCGDDGAAVTSYSRLDHNSQVHPNGAVNDGSILPTGSANGVSTADQMAVSGNNFKPENKAPGARHAVKATVPMEFNFMVRASASTPAVTADGEGWQPGSSRTRSKSSNDAPLIPDFAILHAAHEASVAAGRAAAIHPVIPKPFNLQSEKRAEERREFERGRQHREEEAARLAELRRREQEAEEEREYRDARKRAVPKANAVPEWYRDIPKRAKD